MSYHYPFPAIVGCDPDDLEPMGLALILTTISPHIGGVLVRGEKGTAKSTAVRALAAVLPPIETYEADRFSVDPSEASATSPDGPFTASDAIITRPVRLVELPVGATEDRLLGSLHLENALSKGKVEFEPGLLAAAHRGLLYVDEVNLLHDHLVDLLLDAAAMGRVHVERDAVSVEHDARFVLIGTMNPEEGELRPQLLDRFGLTVEVSAPKQPELRAEVVRRRIAFDTNPASFATAYESAEAELTNRIEAARHLLATVKLGEAALLKIAEVCAAFEVDGLRADIVTARTATAHAAWQGRSSVTKADIRQAALLALPHRRRRNPFDAPGLDEELLDQILGDDDLPPEPAEPNDPPEPDPNDPKPDGGDQSSAEHETRPPAAPPTDAAQQEPPELPLQAMAPDNTTVVTAQQPYVAKLFTAAGIGKGNPGRRSRAIADTGRRVGASRGSSGSIHLVETLKAAANRAQPNPDGKVRLAPVDLRSAVREGRESNLVLFCIDASGSMAARKRMSQAKTAILSLLMDAYRRRDKVGLVTFRGATADLVLPPTTSVEAAARRLDELPAGGRTPLAEGLLESARVLQRERLRDPRMRPLLVVVTDGRATSGENPVARSQQAAQHLASQHVATVVIDGEAGALKLGLASKLAVLLQAHHVPVAEVTAEALTAPVQQHLQGAA